MTEIICYVETCIHCVFDKCQRDSIIVASNIEKDKAICLKNNTSDFQTAITELNEEAEDFLTENSIGEPS